MNCGLPLRSMNVAFAGSASAAGAVARARRVTGRIAWAVVASSTMLASAMLPEHLSKMQQLLCQFRCCKNATFAQF